MKQLYSHKTTLILVLILIILPVQLTVAEAISSTRAIEDAEYLREKLETVHPNLYFETSKEEAKDEFKGIVETIEAKENWTRLELYRLLAPFVASFKDGHTFLSINQEFLNYADNGGKVFPLMINIENGRLIVVENFSGREPAAGEEILSINGKSAGEINLLVTGLIGAGRRSFVEAKASRNFPIYFWALFGFSGPFEVTYGTQTGERRTKILEGISVPTYREKKRAKLGKYELDWNLDFPSKEVGLLTINTFTSNLEPQFKQFVKDSFRKIKERGAEKLIIDLRENGGGSTKLSDYLYRFVSDKPFRTFAEVRVKYSDPVLKEKTIYNPITLFRVKVLGDRIIVNKNDYKKPPKTKLRFNGELFLLTGPMTFSTAANFAGLIKDVGAGTIAGEETGGLASSYGDIFKLDLPNSGLPFGVSYKYFLRPAGFDDGRGVIPDISLPNNRIRRYRGEDFVLTELLEKI